MKIAVLFHRRFMAGMNRENFCYVSLRNRIKEAAILVEKRGGDDVMYRFTDGSKLIERTVVHEFKLFKE